MLDTFHGPLGTGAFRRPDTELPDLLADLAQRTHSGAVFGGVVAGRGPHVRFAYSSRERLRGKGASTGVFTGGLSGVAFSPDVNLITRETQGCASGGFFTRGEIAGQQLYGYTGVLTVFVAVVTNVV